MISISRGLQNCIWLWWIQPIGYLSRLTEFLYVHKSNIRYLAAKRKFNFNYISNQFCVNFFFIGKFLIVQNSKPARSNENSTKAVSDSFGANKQTNKQDNLCLPCLLFVFCAKINLRPEIKCKRHFFWLQISCS